MKIGNTKEILQEMKSVHRAHQRVKGPERELGADGIGPSTNEKEDRKIRARSFKKRLQALRRR